MTQAEYVLGRRMLAVAKHGWTLDPERNVEMDEIDWGIPMVHATGKRCVIWTFALVRAACYQPEDEWA